MYVYQQPLLTATEDEAITCMSGKDVASIVFLNIWVMGKFI